MKFNRIFLALILLEIGLSSCLISDQIGSIKVEVMKPGIFSIPDSIRKVAILTSYKLQADTFKIGYIDDIQIIIDTNIKYQDLRFKCADATAKFISEYGNFNQVTNYGDSLNFIFNKSIPELSSEDILEEVNADMCIIIDSFHLRNELIRNENGIFFNSVPSLRWIVTYKNDQNFYCYNQHDTLTFNTDDFNLYNLKKGRLKAVLDRCAQIEGEYFGTKLIPTWTTVDRLYYKSKNQKMQLAMQLALKNDWESAAKIWNSETKSKNRNIATKAKFNMALVCEMEGRPDLGIGWLTKSYNEFEGNDIVHKTNCQRYINVLAIRQKDITKLKKQMKY